jgi:hypothetical protein
MSDGTSGFASVRAGHYPGGRSLIVREPRMPAPGLDHTLTGIGVRRAPAGEPGYAATVELVGVHDLVTTEMVHAALAPIRGDILVDLRRCSAIDSATIAVLVACGRELAHEGCDLELIAPPKGSPAEHALRCACIGEHLTIHRVLLEPGPAAPGPNLEARVATHAPRYPARFAHPAVRRRHACQLRPRPRSDSEGRR